MNLNWYNSAATEPLVQVVFLAGTGVFCRLSGILGEESVRDLSKLVLQVTLPLLLFVTGVQSNLSRLFHQGLVVVTAGVFVPLLGYGVGALVSRILRLSDRHSSVVRVTASLSNTAFIGIPLCTAFWGAEGTLMAALFDFGLNVPLLTLPPLEYGRGATSMPWRILVFSPLVWGLILGLSCNWAGLAMPAWAATPLGVLGKVTLPLSLVLVGALVAPTKIGADLLKPLAALLVSRLVLAPLATWILIRALGLHGTGAAVIVLQTAMPASVAATVMAKEYGGEASLAAACALLSVGFALLTVPLIAAGIRLG